MKVKFVYHPKNDCLPPKAIGESVLFEMSEVSSPEPPNAKYWLRCHKCGVSANLGLHEVTIVDELITINPSISCPNKECNAHYWIKNSEIVT